MLPKTEKDRHGFGLNPYGSGHTPRDLEARKLSSGTATSGGPSTAIDLTLDSDDDEAPKPKVVANKLQAFIRPSNTTNLKRKLETGALKAKPVIAQTGAFNRPRADAALVLSSDDEVPKTASPALQSETAKRKRHDDGKSKDEIRESTFIRGLVNAKGIEKHESGRVGERRDSGLESNRINHEPVGINGINGIEAREKDEDNGRKERIRKDTLGRGLDDVKRYQGISGDKSQGKIRAATPTRDPVHINGIERELEPISKKRRLNHDPAAPSESLNTKLQPTPHVGSVASAKLGSNADAGAIATEKAPVGPANAWGRMRWREIDTEIPSQPEPAKGLVVTTDLDQDRPKFSSRSAAPVQTTADERRKRHIPFADDSDSDSDDGVATALPAQVDMEPVQQRSEPTQPAHQPKQHISQSTQQVPKPTQQGRQPAQQEDPRPHIDAAKPAHQARPAEHFSKETSRLIKASTTFLGASQTDLQELAKARLRNYVEITATPQAPVDKSVKQNAVDVGNVTHHEKPRSTTIDTASAHSLMNAVNAARRPSVDTSLKHSNIGKPIEPNTIGKPLEPTPVSKSAVSELPPIAISRRPKLGDAGPRPGSKLTGQTSLARKPHSQSEKEQASRPPSKPSGNKAQKSGGNNYVRSIQRQTKRRAIAREQGLAATRGEVDVAPDESDVDWLALPQSTAKELTHIQRTSFDNNAPRSMASIFNAPTIPKSTNDHRPATESRPTSNFVEHSARKPKPSQRKHVTFAPVNESTENSNLSRLAVAESSAHDSSQASTSTSTSTVTSTSDMDEGEILQRPLTRPICGGKTISNASWKKFQDEMSQQSFDYDDYDEPREPEVSDEFEPIRESSPIDEDLDAYHYLYSVWRKVWFDDDDEEDERYAAWTLCGNDGKGLFTSLQNANKYAGREAMKKRGGIRPADGNVRDWSFQKDDDGMDSYYFESKNRDEEEDRARVTHVRVRVQRALKTPEMRHRPTSKTGWLPKSGYTVYVTTKESKPVYANVPSLDKEDSGVCIEDLIPETTSPLPTEPDVTDILPLQAPSPEHGDLIPKMTSLLPTEIAETDKLPLPAPTSEQEDEDDDHDSLFDSASSPEATPEPEAAPIPEPQRQEVARVQNESTKPIKSHFTSLNHANHYAAETLRNKQYGPDMLASKRLDDLLIIQAARELLNQKLEELKDTKGLFDCETEEPIKGDEGQEITYRVYVEEVKLLGPRNI